MKKSHSKRAESPSELIDARIEELGDWRGEMLARLRALIKAADPEVVEEWKWRGTPVWSHDGLICTGETYKNVVKMTFVKGASLKDPSGLFNSSLEGNVRRAIDFHEGDKLNEKALKALIRAAVALNRSSARDRPPGRPAGHLKARGGAARRRMRARAPRAAANSDRVAGSGISVPTAVLISKAALWPGCHWGWLPAWPPMTIITFPSVKPISSRPKSRMSVEIKSK